MKKEFSFTLALTVALVLHVLLAVLMKYNPLSAAPVAPSSAMNSPVTMQFVESPPNAPTSPEPPVAAKRLSDANRKAGPLLPNKIEPPAPRIKQYASVKGQSAKSAPPSSSASSASEPAQPSAQPEQSSEAESPSDQGDLPAPKLADGALQNLDRFIAKDGSGSSGSGSGSADQEGTVPTGDTGSGVFFDTQGYDLGPWGNHVVAIVRRNWIVPVAAELGLKGIVAISFKVDRSGKIIEPKIISSSNVSSFDQAALQALMISNPFPPLPPDFPRPNLPAVFRFYYNIPVPE
jgi:TonB family protein